MLGLRQLEAPQAGAGSTPEGTRHDGAGSTVASRFRAGGRQVVTGCSGLPFQSMLSLGSASSATTLVSGPSNPEKSFATPARRSTTGTTRSVAKYEWWVVRKLPRFGGDFLAAARSCCTGSPTGRHSLLRAARRSSCPARHRPFSGGCAFPPLSAPTRERGGPFTG